MTNRAALILLLIAVGAIGLILIMSCYVLDTHTSRRLTARRIQRIVDQARMHPRDPRFAKQLLEMAHSDRNFTATIATAALGDLGDAARPVILDIAALMDSPNRSVAQEAANSLSKLGPLSEPALPALKAQLWKDPRDRTTWFAAKAIGRIGQPALCCLPLLKQRLGAGTLGAGTGVTQFDDYLEWGIQLLEEEKARLKNECKESKHQ